MAQQGMQLFPASVMRDLHAQPGEGLRLNRRAEQARCARRWHDEKDAPSRLPALAQKLPQDRIAAAKIAHQPSADPLLLHIGLYFL